MTVLGAGVVLASLWAARRWNDEPEIHARRLRVLRDVARRTEASRGGRVPLAGPSRTTPGRAWTPTAHRAKARHRTSKAMEPRADTATAARFRRSPRISWASAHQAAPAARSSATGGAGRQNRSRRRATAAHSAVWRLPTSHAVVASPARTPAAGRPKSHRRARCPPTRTWTMAVITTALRATRAKA